MVDQLLADVKRAIVKRNPGLEPCLQPGLPGEEIRKALKRAGIGGNVEEVVAVFSHFDGAMYPKENEVSRLGFAPPIVKTMQLPAATLQMFEAMGRKVDPVRTVYGTFYFSRWEGVVYGLKTSRKFAADPRHGVLIGRVVPFFGYSETAQQLAFDTDPSGNGRILSIQPENMKDAPALTEAYASLDEFLRELIEANRNNQCLRWPARLGPPVELPMPSTATAPAKAKKAKLPKLPATDKVLVVRTDFSNDGGWQSLQADLGKESGESALSVEFVSNAAIAGLSAKQLAKEIPDGHGQPIAVIADEATFSADEPTLLVVDLQEKPGRSFRTLPACLQEVYDNLSTANMEFAEFVKAAKADGVYRGSEE